MDIDPKDLSALRYEIEGLKEQLSQAVSLIGVYQTKIDAYMHQVGLLSDKIMRYESTNKVINLTTDNDGPGKNPILPLTVAKSQEPTVPNKPKHSGKRRIFKPSEPYAILHSVQSNIPAANIIEESSSTVAEPKVDDITTVSLDKESETQQWAEVLSKKNRRLTSHCGKAGPNIASLKAVKELKYLHVWNMASTAAEIRDYLQQTFTNGTCTV